MKKKTLCNKNVILHKVTDNVWGCAISLHPNSSIWVGNVISHPDLVERPTYYFSPLYHSKYNVVKNIDQLQVILLSNVGDYYVLSPNLSNFYMKILIKIIKSGVVNFSETKTLFKI